MKWFRFYDDALNDPKVQKLPGDVFKTWVNLLCVASKNNGAIPSDMESLTFILRMPESKITAHIQVIKGAGLLDEGETLTPHNWQGRQYESDSAALRMRRHRQRKRDGDSDVTRDVTVTDDVTAELRSRTEQNRTEQSHAVTRDGDFDEFWKAYPRRADRRHAEKAYRSALKRASHGEILQGLKGYAFSPDPKFIPLAATWLNGDRWRDERPPDKPSDGGFQLRPLGVGG
jgi:hypothetical protein